MEEVKRAAGYIRVSTAEQVTKGLSIETQIAEIEAYAIQQNMKLVGMYIDRGITARKSLERRKDFMRMMGDVESGKIDHIIVLRLDRFFRNVYDYHKMMNEYLNPNKCDWSAVKEQYSTTTTNGRLMINLRLSIAEQECDTDGDRIKDVFNHRVEQGFAIGGSLPMGLMVKDKHVVKNPETIHIPEAIFDRFEEIHSVRGTMIYINATYGTNLNYIAVSRILRNPLFAGIYRNNENYCERTISIERHKKIQKILEKNIKIKNAAKDYIFTGLLKCDHCGNNLSGNCTTRPLKDGPATYKYYRCPKRTRDYNCDNHISIHEAQVEKYLLDNVEALMKEYIIKVETEAKQQKTVKSNRKQIENKMKKLNDLYMNDFISMEEYKSKRAELEAQIIDEPKKEIKDLSVMNDFLNSDFKTIYNTLNELEKRALWRSVIQEISVSGKEVKNVIFL